MLSLHVFVNGIKTLNRITWVVLKSLERRNFLNELEDYFV